MIEIVRSEEDMTAIQYDICNGGPLIKELAKAYPANILYRLKNLNRNVIITGYAVHGNIIVTMPKEYNKDKFPLNNLLASVTPEHLHIVEKY